MFKSDVFVEAEYEVASSFFINSKETLRDIPSVEIFLVDCWNVEWYFDSTFDCVKAENVIFDCYGTWEVVSDRAVFDYWFALGFFDHSTSLFYTTDAELCRKSKFFESLINKRMQFDIIFNSFSPCNIDADLECFSINFYSFNYFGSCSDSNLSTNNNFHNYSDVVNIYKCIENGGGQFLPVINYWVSLPILS